MNGPKIEVSEEEYALYVKLNKLSFLTFKIMAVFAALLVIFAMIFRNGDEIPIPYIFRLIGLLLTLIGSGIVFSPLIYQFIIIQRKLKE